MTPSYRIRSSGSLHGIIAPEDESSLHLIDEPKSVTRQFRHIRSSGLKKRRCTGLTQLNARICRSYMVKERADRAPIDPSETVARHAAELHDMLTTTVSKATARPSAPTLPGFIPPSRVVLSSVLRPPPSALPMPSALPTAGRSSTFDHAKTRVRTLFRIRHDQFDEDICLPSTYGERTDQRRVFFLATTCGMGVQLPPVMATHVQQRDDHATRFCNDRPFIEWPDHRPSPEEVAGSRQWPESPSSLAGELRPHCPPAPLAWHIRCLPEKPQKTCSRTRKVSGNIGLKP